MPAGGLGRVRSLAMAKERTEYRQRNAAMVDALIGIANRRSFLQNCNEMMKRHATAIRAPRRCC
jgi:GGDEF domain-containing protein